MNNTVHAVFLDIRMPGMTGLDFIKSVLEQKPDTVFIIVSGYADFSYAKKAIEYGVFDYCLKPIEQTKTDELLKRLSERLKSISISGELELLGEILSGSVNIDRFPFRVEPNLAVVMCSCIKQMESLLCLNSNITASKFLLSSQRAYFLLSAPDIECLNAFIKKMELFPFESGILGISSTATDKKLMQKLFIEAENAFYSFLFQDKTGVCFWRASSLRWVNSLVNAFADHYKNKDIEAALKEIEKLDCTDIFVDEMCHVWNGITALVLSNICGEELTQLEYISVNDAVNRFADYRQMIDELVFIIRAAYSPADPPLHRDEYEPMILFVQENYANDLSLKLLADRFHLNFTYCSELFKKLTGTTFSKYIIDLRMKKAKELLQSEITLKEVAAQTGYSDYFYFLSVFKKYNGITPAKYRLECIKQKLNKTD